MITGRPNIGRTTVLLNAATALKNKGYHVGGMLSREVREKGARVGFEAIDFSTGNKGWLGHVHQPAGPQVSKYKINLGDLDQIGVKAIQDSLKVAEVIVINEIGSMQLFSSAFKEAIRDAIDGQKLVLSVIQHDARDPLIDSIKKTNDIELVAVTLENTQRLCNFLMRKTIQFLREARETG
jgi:nucleoside-triphosphatase